MWGRRGGEWGAASAGDDSLKVGGRSVGGGRGRRCWFGCGSVVVRVIGR